MTNALVGGAGWCRSAALGLLWLALAGPGRAGQELLPESEPNDDAVHATNLGNALSGGVALGHIASTGDVDYFSFAAQSGDVLHAATMTGFADLGQADSLLQILDTDGVTVLAQDDNQGSYGPTASSVAGVAMPASGSFFLRVSATGSSTQIRPYHLHYQLRRGSPDPEPEPTGPVPPSGWITGVFSFGDVDRFSFSLAAGDTVFLSIDLDPTNTGGWNGAIGLRSFQGSTLTTPLETDPSAHRSQAFFMTVKDGGTYEVSVGTLSGGGAANFFYELSVTVHPNTPETNDCTTYNAVIAPPNIPIPDALPNGTPGELQSILVVPGHPRIADLDVSVSLSHERMNNLDVQLISPAGNDDVLFSDIGASVGNPAQTQMEMVFDDEAALRPSYDTVAGMACLPGNALSQRSSRLSWFDGEDAGGTWILHLRDDSNGGVGFLQGWSVTICEPPPPPECPPGSGRVPVFAQRFESNDGGFTASGTGVEWEWGSPDLPPVFPPSGPNGPCNLASVLCWKTDLDARYDPNTNQDLVSPSIDLDSILPPILLTWAQKYQMGTAQSDHAFAEVRLAGGGSARRVFEHLGPEMTSAVLNPPVDGSAGWGTHSADISEFAGSSIELRYHLDSGPTNELAGYAIDDIRLLACQVGVIFTDDFEWQTFPAPWSSAVGAE